MDLRIFLTIGFVEPGRIRRMGYSQKNRINTGLFNGYNRIHGIARKIFTWRKKNRLSQVVFLRELKKILLRYNGHQVSGGYNEKRGDVYSKCGSVSFGKDSAVF
jgi:hypothetical protein